MKGTPNQVRWAEEIRQSIHEDVQRWLSHEPNSKRAAMARDIVLPLIDKIQDATWFIKNENFDIQNYAKLQDGKPDLNYRLLRELRVEAERQL